MHYYLKGVLLTLVVISLLACSKGNDKASNIDPRTGKHPANWAVANTGGAHPAAYLDGPSACFECHGKDLTGGISKVSCFTSSRSKSTRCSRIAIHDLSCSAVGPAAGAVDHPHLWPELCGSYGPRPGWRTSHWMTKYGPSYFCVTPVTESPTAMAGR